MIDNEPQGQPISQNFQPKSESLPTKETLHDKKLDVLIVPGEGPTKDVRFLSELSAEEKNAWEKFREDPRHQFEPAYFVIDDTPHGADSATGIDRNPYFSELEEIRKSSRNQEEKAELIEVKRLKWINTGRFGQRRWGKFNALAAGYSLYTEMADQLILTGGRTLTQEREKIYRQQFLDQNPDAINLLPVEFNQKFGRFLSEKGIPAEAELMRDIIIRRFGKLLFYKQFPEQKSEFDQGKYQEFLIQHLLPRIHIEDEALTTPENVVNTVNKFSSLLTSDKSIGVLSNQHQLDRATIFLRRLGGLTGEIRQISSQEILKQRAIQRNKNLYVELMRFFTEAQENEDLQKRATGDADKVARMNNPQRFPYWAFTIGMLNEGSRMQTILNDLLSSSAPNEKQRWINSISKTFAMAGILYTDNQNDALNRDNFYRINLSELQKSDPIKFNDFRKKLSALITPEKRDTILDV